MDMGGYNLDPNMLVNALSHKDDDGGMFGGNGLLWIFLLILFGFGGGNGMFGGNNNNAMGIEGQVEAAIAKAQAAGASDQLVLQAISGNKDAITSLGTYLGTEVNQIQNAISSLGKGICDLGYTTGQGTASVLSAINAGNSSLSRQLAECCCNTQRSIDGLGYKMAENFCATNTNIANGFNHIERFIEKKLDHAQAENRAGFQSLRDYLTNEKISTIERDLQTCQFQLSQNAQTKAIEDYIKSVCNPIVNCPNS